MWTLTGEAIGYSIRLISSLILSRLLTPDIYGLMSLLMVCVIGIHMFSDLGIRASVIQHPRGDDPDFYNTAWTIQIVRGFFLWLCATAIAWPVSWFYAQPSLLYLLPLISLTAIIDGFTSTKLYDAERNLNQRRQTLVTIVTQFLSLLITILWALRSPSIWALVAGYFIGPLLRTILSHAIFPGQSNRFRWQPEARADLMRYGRWVSVSSLFAFLSLQADRLIFGKMIPLALLGVYNTGSMYARLPVDTLMRLAFSVAFPLFGRYYRQEGTLKSVFTRVCIPVMTAGGAALSGLILGGPAVIRVLYDERWQQAGWIIQIVCLGSWFQVLESMHAVANGAMGQPKWGAIGNFLKIVAMGITLPLVNRWFGFPGALVAIALSEIPRYLVVRWKTLAAGLGNVGFEGVLTGAVLGCCGLAYLLHLGRAAIHSPWIGVGAAGAAYLAVWVPLGLWAFRRWKRTRGTGEAALAF
jgi:O-antigen/teichoic acid export membrane protein